jgi:hypothetical protein
VGGRLVENQYWRIGEQRPRQGDSLVLAARHRSAILADLRGQGWPDLDVGRRRATTALARNRSNGNACGAALLQVSRGSQHRWPLAAAAHPNTGLGGVKERRRCGEVLVAAGPLPLRRPREFQPF